MNKTDMSEVLAPILERDARYAAESYLFVRLALEHTVRKLDAPRHVSGQELLMGIRECALQQFGPVSRRVLHEWGIDACIDFGNIVFNLVNEGLLGRTEHDSIEDFMEGYDFSDAFVHPFRPRSKAAPLPPIRLACRKTGA